MKINDMMRELSALKDSFTVNLRKIQENISEELILGFSSVQSSQSSSQQYSHQSTNLEEKLISSLPKQFSWKEPFYALGKHYYFIKSRFATEMNQFLGKNYSEFENSGVVLKYFCGLRNEWKKRISEAKRIEHEFSEEDYSKVMPYWKDSFGTLTLTALEGGDVRKNFLFLFFKNLK